MPGVNSLTRKVGLRVGSIVLETLVKHYFEKIKRDFIRSNNGNDKDDMVQLRQDELIYDEIFTIVKAFMEATSFHSVEDLQAFSNTRTPSPPWVHVVRVQVPMASCDEAANHLVTVLGGEEVAQKLIGGVKWWQVRSIDGVDAQWITAKKDWREAKRRYKEREKTQHDEPSLEQTEDPTYHEDMDALRCILYAHGGGYYFGSVDQERYSIQRYARKINGRVFAINYRLAPQYPFPCAIQDLLASYLYLIQPPPGAAHRPVKPSHIVVAGDSAGGGLTLALLQVLRDASLPLPAGGILISPWCDMTHSFPSIHINTATDIIPKYGLSMHKPSTLWPPPDEELAGRMRTGLRKRVRAVFKGEQDPNASVVSLEHSGLDPTSSGIRSSSDNASTRMQVDVGATTPLPLPHPSSDSLNPNATAESITLQAQNGETLSIHQQIQLYTTNALLGHPLVSPALGYLGGLPPLMMVISDKEVLRDEGIYTAHKAAHPEQFPIQEATRKLYPALDGIEERFKGKPTPVHLQVYDDTAHVLPVLFSFTTPAKYCFRAMAIFCKYVTGVPLFPNGPESQAQVHTQPPSGAELGSDVQASASMPASPRSIRSFGSLASSGSGLFSSIRGSGRKSPTTSTVTNNSDSSSDLKKSIIGRSLSTPSMGRSKGKARSVSVPQKELQAFGEGHNDSGEYGTVRESARAQGDGDGQGMSNTPKKRRNPVHPLSLSPPPVLSPAKPSPLSTPLPPSPTTLDSRRLPEPEITLNSNALETEAEAASRNGTVVGVSYLTASPKTSPMPSPAPSVRSSVSLDIDSHHLRSSSLSSSKITSEPPLSLSQIPSSASQSLHPHSREVNVTGTKINGNEVPTESGERCAGDPIVYSETEEFPSLYTSIMIRERVSTRGVIRPLEPPSDLPALNVPAQLIGEVSELAMRRYIEGRTLLDKKFSSTIKEIEKRRKKHLKKARKDTLRNMNALKGSVEREKEKIREGKSKENSSEPGVNPQPPQETPFSIETALLASSGWSWSWALDHNEHPPPSSLVARRDTHEALLLARIADEAVLQEDQVKGLGGAMSGNNLWTVVLGFLTYSGIGGAKSEEKKDTSSHSQQKEKEGEPASASATPNESSVPTKTTSSSSPSRLGIIKKPSVSRIRARIASLGKPMSSDSSSTPTMPNQSSAST